GHAIEPDRDNDARYEECKTDDICMEIEEEPKHVRKADQGKPEKRSDGKFAPSARLATLRADMRSSSCCSLRGSGRKPMAIMWRSMTSPMAASSEGTYLPSTQEPPRGSNTAFNSSTTKETSPPRRNTAEIMRVRPTVQA